MPRMNSLEDLMVEQLQDLYDAEHQIVEALPKMAEKANSQQLKSAFQMHLDQSKQQINRLEQVFQAMGQNAERKTCKAMQGLVAEGQEMMREQAAPEVMDAGLIAAAQRIEHYEIAGYGTVRTFAEQLGQREAAQLLEQTLNEEKQTDEKLTQVATSQVNQRAQS